MAPTPDDTHELRVIESTEQGEDPLGIDRSTGSDLDEAAKRLTPAKAVVLPSAVSGPVLSSLSQVTETSHQILIRIEQGLAFIQVNLELDSKAKYATEASYRLALPEGAVLLGLSACQGRNPCVAAGPRAVATEPAPSPSRTSLWLAGELIRDHAGPALAIRVGPIAPEAKLALEVRYMLESPLRGGHVQLHLPARGQDPRIAPTSRVQVLAPGFQSLEVAEEFSWDASLSLELRAEWPPEKPLTPPVTRARCGRGWCTRRYRAVGSTATPVRPTWLWIDASPSMEGPARGRVDSVLAALLTALPAQTPVRAAAFAARARELGQFSAESVPLTLLSEATMSDLDAGTRPSAAFALHEHQIAKERPRILILSDGLLDPSADDRRALQLAHERGAELWLLAVGDRPPVASSRTLRVLWLAEEADRALKQGDLAQLGDALGRALSKPLSTGLIAGEQQVVEQRPHDTFVPDGGSHWLGHWLARSDPPPPWSSASPAPRDNTIAAIPFTSVPESAPRAYTAMPAESVLDMLRTQLVPKARACLRSDRRGRGDYAVALSFLAFFSHREVSEVSIDGKIPEHLRTCLTDLLPKLRVPAFSGGVRVRYPIHTDREPPPPVIELTPEISESVRRVMATPLPHRAAVPSP
ncbi:MAG: hypothetical protein QM778_32485 [Myxococcales bacterium]